MIWNFIRDFLVQYIFGGTTSDNKSFGGFLGVVSNDNLDYSQVDTNFFYVNIGKNLSGGDDVFYQYISIGDWLSTTTTIIIMCAIVFAFALLVRWVFKTVTSAFLLR